MLTLHNGWGKFILRGYELHGGGAEPQGIGILIEQFVPFEAQLLERLNATCLSPRQKEVALLSLKGVRNAEIAQRLHLTPYTVKDHLKAIYNRLDVNSREELVELLSCRPDMPDEAGADPASGPGMGSATRGMAALPRPLG